MRLRFCLRRDGSGEMRAESCAGTLFFSSSTLLATASLGKAVVKLSTSMLSSLFWFVLTSSFSVEEALEEVSFSRLIRGRRARLFCCSPVLCVSVLGLIGASVGTVGSFLASLELDSIEESSVFDSVGCWFLSFF